MSRECVRLILECQAETFCSSLLELINAIRIKKDREVHIFRTEKPEEKKSLLSAFKRILEETMSRKRKESVWEAEHRRDVSYLCKKYERGGH